jgi:hypothetical protein
MNDSYAGLWARTLAFALDDLLIAAYLILVAAVGAVANMALISAFFVLVVTGYGALHLARRVEGAALVHGFLVGLLVALISLVLDLLFIRAIELVGLRLYVLMVVAGLLGGVLGSRRRGQL